MSNIEVLYALYLNNFIEKQCKILHEFALNLSRTSGGIGKLGGMYNSMNGGVIKLGHWRKKQYAQRLVLCDRKLPYTYEQSTSSSRI